LISAMNAVRFGSYSSRSTVAGTSNLRRLKSTRSVALLVAAAAPPHRDAAVIVAPALFLPSVSALTGLPFHSSLRSTVTSWRCDGVVGLYV
jgi:hypothetical protein